MCLRGGGGGKDPFVTVPRQCPSLYTKRAIICSVILSPPQTHTHTHPASVPFLVYIYIYIYVMDIRCFWGLYPTVPRLRGYTVGYSTKTHSISNIYPILPPNGTTSTTRENVCINLTVKLIFICNWNLKHFGLGSKVAYTRLAEQFALRPRGFVSHWG